MPGWKDDIDFDEIEGHAQHKVNNEGRREYNDTYAQAKAIIGGGRGPAGTR